MYSPASRHVRSRIVKHSLVDDSRCRHSLRASLAPVSRRRQIFLLSPFRGLNYRGGATKALLINIVASQPRRAVATPSSDFQSLSSTCLKTTLTRDCESAWLSRHDAADTKHT